MLHIFCYIFSCLLAFPAFSQETQERKGTGGTKGTSGVDYRAQAKAGYKLNKVIIDPGHGGKDPGTSTRTLKEKDIALQIALQLGKHIRENMPSVEVLYTRTTDVFVPLEERANFANKEQADVFISIHCNWIRKRSIYGSETYVMGVHKNQENFEVAKRENSVITLEDNAATVYEGFDPASPESYILFSLYQSAYHQNSLNLASKIEKQFKTRAGRHSLGVKTAGFMVLFQTSMPSVLVETGYLSNTKEAKELASPKHQSYIASAIYRAFKNYKQELELR